MDIVEKKLREITAGEVLDIACGRGDSTLELAEYLGSYKRLVGIDMVLSALTEARAKSEGRPIEYLQMNAASLAFDDASFDTVSISNSLHHLANTESVLSEMLRVTRPGGRLMIFEMVRDGLTEAQQSHKLVHHWWAAIDRRAGIVHNETLTRDEIIGMVEAAGARELEVHEVIVATGDIHDPETIKTTTDIMDTYPDKIAGHPDHDRLEAEGRELRQRFERVGFAWATGLAVFARR